MGCSKGLLSAGVEDDVDEMAHILIRSGEAGPLYRLL